MCAHSLVQRQRFVRFVRFVWFGEPTPRTRLKTDQPRKDKILHSTE